MKDRYGVELEIGDTVYVMPDKDNLATNEFQGTIRDIRTDSHCNEIADVEDAEEMTFSCETHELEKIE